MGAGPGCGGARAPNCTAPTTLSLCLNAALTTSYGCGPLVTPPCYDDEVCSEFQLLELPDRLCSSVRPSEYQPASPSPSHSHRRLLSFSSLWRNEEVVGAHRPALERETSERTAAPVARRRRRRRLPTTSPNHRLSLSSTSFLRPNCLSLDRPLDHPHQQQV